MGCVTGSKTLVFGFTAGLRSGERLGLTMRVQQSHSASTVTTAYPAAAYSRLLAIDG